MEWVETTGRTVEEAKEAALDELGVDESDAEFEILEEARMGLFGRVRSEARVRARVRPTRPRPKDDRRRRRRRPGERDGVDATVAAAAPPERGVEGTSGPPAGPDASGDADSGAADERGETPVTTEMAIEERLEVARDFVAGVVERFGLAASVDATFDEDDNSVQVLVSGQDLGLLIGPRGATLAALQELARTVVQRRAGTIGERITVDVAGYWQRRREALERFTRQVAAEVQATGVRKVLEPMTAADRKVVHDAVGAIAGVRTISEGEEPRRRVVLEPETPSP